MAVERALTTTDNPWSPFDNFDEWFVYDQKLGYNTPSLLALLVVDSFELSKAQQDSALEHAMNEIVEENVSGVHVIVTQEV